MCSRLATLVVVVIGLLFAGTTHADWVQFPSADHENQFFVTARLFKPDGNGPFPAVVLLHGCGGLGPGGVAQQVEFAWAKRLRDWGYIALTVDSFSPRGLHHGVCILPDEKWLSSHERAKDAYGALEYLRAQSFVQPERIGVMGWSNGGVATLDAMNLDLHSSSEHKFRAAITFYPECGLEYGKWKVKRECGDSGPVTNTEGVYRPTAPLLILSGAADDWTPAAYCKTMVNVARAHEYALELVVYPGAHHSFDGGGYYFYIADASNINKCTACCGGTVEGNAAATQDAIKQVKSFFGKHLGD
jgi:dienelactone hydrolase